MTKKQKINQTLKSSIYGVLTAIILIVVGYLWIRATTLLIDIEGFGLGSMVLWFPFVGYGVIGVGILVLVFAIVMLIKGMSQKKVYATKAEDVKKNQQVALETEFSSFTKQRIKGVIFDLDGTLLDTLEDLTDALNVVLVNHQYPIYRPDEVRQMVGHGLRNLVKTAFVDTLDEDTLDKYYNEFLDVYAKNYQNKTVPYPEVIELVKLLNSKGYLLGIISNKHQEYTKELVKTHFPGIPFVDVIGDSVDMPRKPDPSSTLLIMEEMMLPKSQVILVGDSVVDLQTARNANIAAIAVTWGFKDKADLLLENPLYVADAVNDVYRIIEEINHQELAA